MCIDARISGIAAVVAVAMAAANGLAAPMLTSIGVLDPANPASGVHAISPDGTYAVGYSNGPDSLGSATIQQPIIWSVGSGLVQLPNPADTNGLATGVVVRTGGADIGVGGNIGGNMQYYKAPSGSLASGSWVSAPVPRLAGPYNSARIRTTTIGAGDQWFVGGSRPGSIRSFVLGVDVGPSLDHRNTPFTCTGNAVAGNGNLAGYDNGNPSSARRALFMNGNNGTAQTVVPGGSGVLSEAFGITEDISALSGYDTNADTVTSQAFVWKVGDAAMTLIGTLGADTHSNAIAVKLIGGNWITAGYSSDGATERAVVWDTTATWSSSGQPMLVSSLLAATGVDTSAWSQLTRVTTMSDDGMTVAGWGIWAADGSTRGFVATIPEPATLSMLGLALCALLRRRR